MADELSTADDQYYPSSESLADFTSAILTAIRCPLEIPRLIEKQLARKFTGTFRRLATELMPLDPFSAKAPVAPDG